MKRSRESEVKYPEDQREYREVISAKRKVRLDAVSTGDPEEEVIFFP